MGLNPGTIGKLILLPSSYVRMQVWAESTLLLEIESAAVENVNMGETAAFVGVFAAEVVTWLVASSTISGSIPKVFLTLELP